MFYEYLVKLQVLKNKNVLSKRLIVNCTIFLKVQTFLNNFGLNILMTLEFEPCCDFPRLSTKNL